MSPVPTLKHGSIALLGASHDIALLALRIFRWEPSASAAAHLMASFFSHYAFSVGALCFSRGSWTSVQRRSIEKKSWL